MLNRKLAILIFLSITGLLSGDCYSKTETFVLWQLPSQTGNQMNSYVMQTVNGRVMVIDGGYAGDADYLKGFLAALGNQIDIWFVSHLHHDHIEALMTILKNPGDLKINKIYGSMLDEQWINVHARDYFPLAIDFKGTLQKAQKEVIELTLGQIIKIDGITIEIFGIKNPEITNRSINNSSVVMRVWDSKKSILFTGDLGLEGGNKLLNSKYKDRLKSDYVQMSHHGTDGVSEDFYKTVSPKYCIWPTPLWLWDNNDGSGKGKGPWETKEVRGWIDKLNIQKHYMLFDGLQKIN